MHAGDVDGPVQGTATVSQEDEILGVVSVAEKKTKVILQVKKSRLRESPPVAPKPDHEKAKHSVAVGSMVWRTRSHPNPQRRGYDVVLTHAPRADPPGNGNGHGSTTTHLGR